MARVTNASPSERRNTASSKVKLRGQFTIISEHHHGYDDDDDDDDDDDYHDDDNNECENIYVYSFKAGSHQHILSLCDTYSLVDNEYFFDRYVGVDHDQDN